MTIPKEYCDLIEKYGTPLFIIDLEGVKENFLRFKGAFGKDTIVAYSYKTNYHPAILKLLDKNAAFSEVISDMEYNIGKDIGIDFSKMILNGPGKSIEELEFAIKNDFFLINADSIDDLKLVDAKSMKLKKVVNLGIRVNSESSDDSKFGIFENEMEQAIELINKNTHMNLIALHVHYGTNNLDSLSYIKSLRKLSNLIKEFDLDLKYIDLGGGFAPEWKLKEKKSSIDSIANDILREKESLGLNQSLIFEPGRYIVEDACFALSKVRSIKNKWIILDVGSNILIPLVNSNYGISFFKEGDSKLYDFGGNMCFEADVISKDVQSPDLVVGDIIKIENVGAYTLSMAEQFIYPLPTILVKKGKKYSVSFRSKFVKIYE